MGFITNVLDLKKLAKNLDRKTAIAVTDNAEHDERFGLDEYISQKIFLPMLVDGVIPIAGLDIGRITDEDIEQVYDVFCHNDFKVLSFCVKMQEFPASPVERQLVF